MSHRIRSLAAGFLILCAVVSLGTLTIVAYAKWHASQLFREVVLDPVPKSVSHIKAERVRWLNKHTYVFRFRISRDDLARLVHTGPYDAIAYVDFDRGVLSYGEKEYATSSIWLYEVPRGDRLPAWFDLARWTRCQTWIAEKEQPDLYNVRLVLFHEGTGEAYFIEHEMRGTWGVLPSGIGKEYRKAKEAERAPYFSRREPQM